MGVSEIKKDMDEFQNAVQKLSYGVGKASSLWRDSRFSDLSLSIGKVAIQSRDLMSAGDKCCETLNKFYKIAAEKY